MNILSQKILLPATWHLSKESSPTVASRWAGGSTFRWAATVMLGSDECWLWFWSTIGEHCLRSWRVISIGFGEQLVNIACGAGELLVMVLVNNWWTLRSWKVISIGEHCLPSWRVIISIGGKNPRLGFATHCSVSDDCSFFTSATFPMIGQSKASTPTLLGY